MRPAIPIAIGQRFTRWLVISGAQKPGRQRVYLCRCDCGTEKLLPARSLNAGLSKSCGCLRDELSRYVRHGHARSNDTSKTYYIWAAMCVRCNCSSNKAFHNYGGRGIAVCERWLHFENFLADMGEAPPGLTLERDDVNGNYEPSNCSWVSRLAQNNNTRANVFIFASEIKYTLAEFVRKHGLRYDAVRWQLRKGVRYFAGQSITVQYPGDRV